jgi:nicotinamide-nucleotide amidase
MQIAERIHILVGSIGPQLLQRGWMVAVAESCTGGGVVQALTSISGSSAWVDGGLVTYSNDAKIDLLGVSDEILNTDGAVSASCALAMVAGIRPNKMGLLRLATTGIAGPLGGTPHKPVGTVFIAYQAPHQFPQVHKLVLSGTREEICQQTIFYALRDLILASLYEKMNDIYCFYALMLEEEGLQQACHDYGLKCGIPILHLEPRCNLHVTLAYLGKIKGDAVDDLCESASKVASKMSPFSLRLGGLRHWAHVKSYVVDFEDIPGALITLSSLLGASNITPHITLSKRNPEMHINGEHEALLLDWRVSHFSLMMSYKGVFYQELKQWQFENKE